jgi:hypothetical protein
LELAPWAKQNAVKRLRDLEFHIGVPMDMNLGPRLQLKLKYQKLGIALSAGCQHRAIKIIRRRRPKLNRTKLI